MNFKKISHFKRWVIWSILVNESLVHQWVTLGLHCFILDNCILEKNWIRKVKMERPSTTSSQRTRSNGKLGSPSGLHGRTSSTWNPCEILNILISDRKIIRKFNKLNRKWSYLNNLIKYLTLQKINGNIESRTAETIRHFFVRFLIRRWFWFWYNEK